MFYEIFTQFYVLYFIFFYFFFQHNQSYYVDNFYI